MVDILDGFLPPDPPVSKARVKGAEVLDCGHTNWYTTTENEAAREAGHCCRGGQQKVVPCWRSLRGKYVRPIPLSARRTREKERAGGFPGLCCDDAGFYIGGVGNDCLRWRPEGTSPCQAHRPEQVVAEQQRPARGRKAQQRSTVGH